MTGPRALFITWTVYGTFLPGDGRGWRHRKQGDQYARPRLAGWAGEQLRHDVVLLDSSMRAVVEAAIRQHCELRGWHQWAISVRSNHIHAVVTAAEYRPELVRDQLKARATRELRAAFDTWVDRPVWTAKGDIEFLDADEEIENCVVYVAEAQDRKDRDHK